MEGLIACKNWKTTFCVVKLIETVVASTLTIAILIEVLLYSRAFGCQMTFILAIQILIIMSLLFDIAFSFYHSIETLYYIESLFKNFYFLTLSFYVIYNVYRMHFYTSRFISIFYIMLLFMNLGLFIYRAVVKTQACEELFYLIISGVALFGSISMLAAYRYQQIKETKQYKITMNLDIQRSSSYTQKLNNFNSPVESPNFQKYSMERSLNHEKSMQKPQKKQSSYPEPQKPQILTFGIELRSKPNIKLMDSSIQPKESEQLANKKPEKKFAISLFRQNTQDENAAARELSSTNSPMNVVKRQKYKSSFNKPFKKMWLLMGTNLFAQSCQFLRTLLLISGLETTTCNFTLSYETNVIIDFIFLVLSAYLAFISSICIFRMKRISKYASMQRVMRLSEYSHEYSQFEHSKDNNLQLIVNENSFTSRQA